MDVLQDNKCTADLGELIGSTRPSEDEPRMRESSVYRKSLPSLSYFYQNNVWCQKVSYTIVFGNYGTRETNYFTN